MRHEKLFDMDAETNSYRPYHEFLAIRGLHNVLYILVNPVGFGAG